jgi:hypothetical protein
VSAVAARPFVLVLSRVPLLTEALVDALAGIADVRAAKSPDVDTPGLLRSLRPDAIVVDGSQEAEAAVVYARSAAVPLLHVCLPQQKLRVLEHQGWRDDTAGPTPQALRNALAEAVYRRAPR